MYNSRSNGVFRVTKDDLQKLKEWIAELSEDEKKERDIYLKRLANGTFQGPLVGYPSIDKIWLRYYNDEYITTDMPKMSVYEYLFECNKNYLNRIALSYYGKKITFAELFYNIDRTASSLKAIGVKENEIVTISMPNTPEAVYLFYAISKIGAIANMVDPRTSSEGIHSYIDEVKSDKVFIVDSYYNKVKSLSENGMVKQIIAISPAESLPVGLNIGYKLKEHIEAKKDSSKKLVFNSNTMN